MTRRFHKMTSLLNSLSQHTLYTRLLLLLGCMLMTILLMQASSFFLLDYIPSSQTAIDKVNSQKVYWHRQLSFINAISIEEADETLSEMQQNYLRLDDPDARWMLKQDDAQIREAVLNLEKLQQSFSRVAGYNMRLTAQLRMAERIAESYDVLHQALTRDAEVKRTVIALLQSISLIFVLSCFLVIAISARRLMIDRFDNTLRFINQKVGSDETRSGADEFAHIENRVAELTAQVQGADAEIDWANRTSEHVKTLVRAQDFLLRFIESASDDVMSEQALLKMLYGLERIFNFNNAALIYADDAAVIKAQRVIFSHHKPATLNDKQFDELLSSGMLSFDDVNHEFNLTSCLAMSFASASNGIGILLVEMDRGRLLEDSEIKTLEITAHLLGMIAKYQSHDEEGRRLAVLEERSAIARELHDSLAQSLSFMKIQVSRLQSASLSRVKVADAASSQKDEEKLAAVISELREGLDNAYRELRELLTTFRVHMDLRGLGYAIQAAIDEFSQRSDINISLDNRLVNCRLTVNEEFHMLHVVREALSNIVRHSGAANVNILMHKQRSGAIELLIDDDGVGLAPASPTYDHHGQAIMKERAYNLGGEVEVMNRRYGGTRVSLVFIPKLAQ
jgi:two-component system nitrate/nitrite sensor histidine kinase NarX